MRNLKSYIHTVHYYETDKMGVTHHSNYIRWMEEARIDFLNQIGWNFTKLEELGIVSPVIGIECDYKHTTTFSDKVTIEVAVQEFNGVKLAIQYVMKNEDGEIVATGVSRHCFLNKEGTPIRMKKEFPEFYDTLNRLV